MNPDTGEIFDKNDLDPEVQKKIKELQGKINEVKKMVDIPDKDFMEVVNMNRKQRREWAAKQRKKNKKKR